MATFNILDLPEGLQERIMPIPECGCWLWIVNWNTYGYGRLGYAHTKQVFAHRYVYEMLVGQIPDGLTIDHVCRMRACVNPAHLEPVTHSENLRRGLGPSAVNLRKTHCSKGHAFTGDNFKHYEGYGRECRLCRRERQTAYYWKNRDAELLEQKQRRLRKNAARLEGAIGTKDTTFNKD